MLRKLKLKEPFRLSPKILLLSLNNGVSVEKWQMSDLRQLKASIVINKVL